MSYIYNLTDTWNAAGSAFNGIKMAITNTASASSSYMINLTTSGATTAFFTVDKNGATALSAGISSGANSGTLGSVKLYGSTSGDVTIKPNVAAGTATIFQLPATNGTANYALTTNGSGVTSWAQISLSAGVTGTLPVANGGTNNSTAYTAGSITFFDGTSIAQNNAKLFWDNTNFRVGVGTASPGSTVDIRGELRAYTVLASDTIADLTGALGIYFGVATGSTLGTTDVCNVIADGGAYGTYADLIFYPRKNGADVGKIRMFTNGTERFQVGTSGNIYAQSLASGAGTNAVKYNTTTKELTYDTSSARYKDNIRDSKYGLDAIMSLRSAMFEYKQDARTDIGLIAEEVANVLPELVARDAEGRPDSVAYDRMVSVLIKAVQELKAELDALR